MRASRLNLPDPRAQAEQQHLERLAPVMAALNSPAGATILKFLEERFDGPDIARGTAEESHARAAQRDVVVRLRQVRDLAKTRER